MHAAPSLEWTKNLCPLLKGGGSSSPRPSKDYLVTFQDQLQLKGLIILEMEKDGNCLFRSIADQLSSNPEDHGTYRQIATRYLSEHSTAFKQFMTLGDSESPEDYIKRMSLNGTWGSHLEIQALCEALNIQVNIHIKDKDPICIQPNTSSVSEAINLAFHPIQEHYDSVRNLDEISKCFPLSLTKKGSLDRRSKAFKKLCEGHQLKRKATTPLSENDLKKVKLSPVSENHSASESPTPNGPSPIDSPPNHSNLLHQRSNTKECSHDLRSA